MHPPQPPPDGAERLYAALADIGDLVAAMPPLPELYAETVRILERHVGAWLVIVGEIDHATGLMHRRAPDPPPPGQEDIYPATVPIHIARPSFWQGHIDVEPNLVDAPGREALRPACARYGIRAAAAARRGIRLRRPGDDGAGHVHDPDPAGAARRRGPVAQAPRDAAVLSPGRRGRCSRHRDSHWGLPLVVPGPSTELRPGVAKRSRTEGSLRAG